MAFSFNPSQQQPSGGQGISPAGIAPPGGADGQVAPENLPPEGDSPILFIRLRGREMTIAAYLQMLLIVVNVLVVATAIIFFAYSQYLSVSVEKKKEELLAKESGFKEYPYEEMKRLSARYALLNGILKEYLSLETPLQYLESVVEKQVYFDNFQLKRSKSSNANFSMGFTVITTNYKYLIQQLASLNLAQYSKIVPKTKHSENIIDTQDKIKVNIEAQIVAQGKASGDVDFKSLIVSSSTTNSATSSQR